LANPAIAPGEWVFFVDNDESVSPQLGAEIRKLKTPAGVNGYFVPRKGIVEEKLLRLGRKGSGLWRRAVHETWEIKGKVGVLRNTLLHHDNLSLAEQITKINFYSTLHAQANRDEGKKATVFKIAVFPILKFWQTFLVKKAYKSGMKGFVFSLMQAFGSFLAWTKLYFLQS